MTAFIPNPMEQANQVSSLKVLNVAPKVEQPEPQRQTAVINNQGQFANQDIGMVPQIEGVNEVIFLN